MWSGRQTGGLQKQTWWFLEAPKAFGHCEGLSPHGLIGRTLPETLKARRSSEGLQFHLLKQWPAASDGSYSSNSVGAKHRSNRTWNCNILWNVLFLTRSGKAWKWEESTKRHRRKTFLLCLISKFNKFQWHFIKKSSCFFQLWRHEHLAPGNWPGNEHWCSPIISVYLSLSRQKTFQEKKMPVVETHWNLVNLSKQMPLKWETHSLLKTRLFSKFKNSETRLNSSAFICWASAELHAYPRNAKWCKTKLLHISHGLICT